MKIGIGIGIQYNRRNGEPPTPAAPANVTLPSLTGTGAVGTNVTCNPGVWSGYPAPTFAYNFKVDGVSVQNTASATYAVQAADSGKAISCDVTATNSEGSATATSSNSIIAGTAPANTVAPTVSPSGQQVTGTAITVNVGTWTGSPTISYEYRWTRNGSPISGAANTTYTIQAADDGTTIRCELRGTNAYGVSSYIASSNSVSAVNAVAPVNTVAPVISGNQWQGATLSSTTGTWTGVPTPTYSYQWKRGGVDIGGATSSTYTLVAADRGTNITCVVTASNGLTASATSNTLAIIDTLLDTALGNAASAWDINRLLRGAHGTSAVVRVRRSSDNTEQDFSVSANGFVDWTSVTSFTGASNGFIVTVYDQTGNNRHATQSTPANQVQIISSGTLLTETGAGSGAVARAGFRFDGSNDVLEVSSSTATYNFIHNGSSATIVGVHRFGSVSNPDTVYSACGNSASDAANVGFVINYDDRSSLTRNNRIVNGVQRGNVAGAAVANVSNDNSINPNQLNLFIAVIDADNATAANRSSVYVNGGAAIQNNSLTNAPSTSNATFNFQWGAAGNNVNLMVGAACSLIMWNADQTANLTTLRNNINDFYRTY